MKISKIIFVLLLIFVVSNGQRKRKGRRGGGQTCHLKDAEKCLDKLSSLGKSKNPTAIIATSQGLDKLCSSIRKEFMGCLKGFFKKCGTPLHREVISIFLDQLLGQSNKLCESGPERQTFLKSSSCLHEKVFSQKQMKDDCNNRYLGTLNKVSANKLEEGQDLASGVCCGYRYWENCSKDLVQSECGDEGMKAFQILITKGFMGLPDMTCPKDLFVHTSSECQAIIVPKGQKVKLNSGGNGVGKYNVATMFSWLFTH